MARIRTIKPDFFKHEDLAAVSPYARLAFIGLWTQADREGRIEDRPRRLKAELFPYEDLEIVVLLDELQNAGFVRRYVVDGRPFLSIPTFRKHQHVHLKEPESTIPAPDEHRTRTGLSVGDASDPVFSTDLHVETQSTGQEPDKHQTEPILARRKGREGKGKEGKEGATIGEYSQGRALTPPLHPSRRGHLDHVWCGLRFCIPDFVANDCWQVASDFLTRQDVVDRLRALAPSWEAAIEGKPLEHPKWYVKEQWRWAVSKLRDGKKTSTEERLYDCSVCGEFHRGHPSEGCKSGHTKMQNGKVPA